MKKLQNLGRELSKMEQTKIMGGDETETLGCPSGENEYNCCVDKTDNTTENVTSCGTSTFTAQANYIASHSNVFSITCS